MIKVSVVMPVYNSEKYVENAVRTILDQSMKEFELILVDDGSTDSSGQICDKLAKKDLRIRVIHKKNGGISSARNEGLKIARGEYIAFCDNDDEYLPGLLEENYQLAIENDADLVRFNRSQVEITESGKSFTTMMDTPDACYETSQFAEHYIDLCSFDNIWGGLYRGDIVRGKHCEFDETMKSGVEDRMFNLCFFPYCKKIVFNSNVYYRWMQRNFHSTSKKFNMNWINSLYKCLKKEENYIKNLIGNVPAFTRVDCLVNRYIYMISTYLLYDNANITLREKIKILDSFSNQTICDKNIFNSVKKELWKQNKRKYILTYLFLKKKYAIILLLIKISQKITNRKRFQKDKNRKI